MDLAGILKNKKIDPEANIWIEFSNGEANILGANEQITHHRPSMLYFGRGLEFAKNFNSREYFYCVSLSSLRKLDDFNFFKRYLHQKIAVNIKARKTLIGGLEIRYTGLGLSSKGKFSRKEYKILREYAKALVD